MDIRKLEAFYKVYELKSFSKAGQELYLSQPTISAHIATLEEELGVRLFDRVGRGIIPTQAGRLLYANVHEILELVEKAKSEILLLSDRVCGELTLGASTIPAHYILPGVLSDFCSMYPEVKIHLKSGDSSEISEFVLDGSLELAIVGNKVEDSDIHCIPLMKDELVIVAPPKMAEKKPGPMSLNEVFSLPWVFREKGSGTRAAFEKALAKLGRDVRNLHSVIQVETTDSVLYCVRAGMGVSVTSRIAAREFYTRGDIAVLDIPGFTMQRSFYLLYNRKRKLFPSAQSFLHFLTEEREFS